MDLESQYTPVSRDAEGRDTFAKFARGLYAPSAGRLSKGARQISIAEIERMLTRLRSRKPHAELRKAVDELGAALRSAGLKLTPAGIKRADHGANMVNKFDDAGVRPDSLQVFKAIHSHGPSQLAKGASFPIESSNATSDSSRASDGAMLASASVQQERARAGVRNTAPAYGGPGSTPHASSVQSRSALPTDDDDDSKPKTAESFTAWLKRQKPCALRPGALGCDDPQDASDPSDSDDLSGDADVPGPDASAYRTHRGGGR